MVNGVKKIGECFKERRMERNLSLKEVESVTSIRMNYLAAIEDGREDQFLSKIYMHGFMRQYADFLELDLDELSREYSLVFNGDKEAVDFAYGIGTLEMGKATHQSSSRWMPMFIWAGISIGILLIAWGFGKYLGVFWYLLGWVMIFFSVARVNFRG